MTTMFLSIIKISLRYLRFFSETNPCSWSAKFHQRTLGKKTMETDDALSKTEVVLLQVCWVMQARALRTTPPIAIMWESSSWCL